MTAWIAVVRGPSGALEVRSGNGDKMGDAIDQIGKLTPANGIGVLFWGEADVAKVSTDGIDDDDTARKAIRRAGVPLITVTIGRGIGGAR